VVVVPATPGAVAVPDGGEPVVLSASGRVMGPVPKKGAPAVPRVRVGTTQLAAGGVIAGPLVGATLALSKSLSPEVAGRLAALKQHRGGLVGKLINGPEVRFGLMQDLPAKAEALDLVLGQMSPQEEREAGYIDVAVPWFPAVGSRTQEPSTTP
jgi:Cell division protein FtsQ